MIVDGIFICVDCAYDKDIQITKETAIRMKDQDIISQLTFLESLVNDNQVIAKNILEKIDLVKSERMSLDQDNLHNLFKEVSVLLTMPFVTDEKKIDEINKFTKKGQKEDKGGVEDSE